jgi:hypothetical protein
VKVPKVTILIEPNHDKEPQRTITIADPYRAGFYGYLHRLSLKRC